MILGQSQQNLLHTDVIIIYPSISSSIRCHVSMPDFTKVISNFRKRTQDAESQHRVILSKYSSKSNFSIGNTLKLKNGPKIERD